MTNREIYDVIDAVFATVDHPEKEEVFAWVEKQRASLDHKNEMARKRAAMKRAEGDALKERIEEILSDSPKTIYEILDTLEEPELTPAKITARMTQLVKAGKANREKVKAEGGRVLVAYTVA